jgi:hypothetical protein
MARGCHGELKKLKIEKNWKEAAKDRRKWRAEKAKTQRFVVPNDDKDSLFKIHFRSE